MVLLAKGLEENAEKALLAGRVKEAFLLEELLENEIIRANLNSLTENVQAKRAVEEILKRAKRAGRFNFGLPTGKSSSSSLGSAAAVIKIYV